MQKTKIDYGNFFLNERMIEFYLKAFIVIFALSIVSVVFIKAIKIDDESLVKIYLKGMIVNPESLIISYEKNLSAGKVDKALIDLRLAVGLMESNKFPFETIKIYKDKIIELNQN